MHFLLAKGAKLTDNKTHPFNHVLTVPEIKWYRYTGSQEHRSSQKLQPVQCCVRGISLQSFHPFRVSVHLCNARVDKKRVLLSVSS
jgi:hypothetical protein